MTEETKQLIINLRWLGSLDYEPEIAQPCLRAADEIERLVKDRDHWKEQATKFEEELEDEKELNRYDD